MDGRRAFVGSFNFDPRPAKLNTEMGFGVDSPMLAGRIHAAFETSVAQVAYEVRLDPSGGLEWVDRSDGTERILTTEPGSGPIKRAIVTVMSWLPIVRLLSRSDPFFIQSGQLPVRDRYSTAGSEPSVCRHFGTCIESAPERGCSSMVEL